MLIDGKSIAEKLYTELAEERKKFGDLKLGLLIADQSPVTASYASIKERGAERLGITIIRKELPDGADTGAALDAMDTLINESDGVIPQLPLASTIDTEAVIRDIPKDKDIDVLAPESFEYFEAGTNPIAPPVASALQYIVQHCGVEISGKKVAVVGQGRLVGKPAAILFAHLGANVSVLERGDDITAATSDADIIILGAGSPGILTPDMIKDGAMVLDAGTSESGGKLVGDADPAVAEKCAYFTPVPGGVGPVAIAMIYKNLFALKSKS